MMPCKMNETMLQKAHCCLHLDKRRVDGDELLQVADPALLRIQLRDRNVQNLGHEIGLQRVGEMGDFVPEQCEFPH